MGLTSRRNGRGQAPVERQNGAPSFVIEASGSSTLNTESEDIEFEAVELTESLMRFATSCELDSEETPAVDRDGPARFQIVDDLVDIPTLGVASESGHGHINLVDPSTWFETVLGDSGDEIAEESPKPLTEDDSPEISCIIGQRSTGEHIVVNLHSEDSAAEGSDEVLAFREDRTSSLRQNERRQHPREDSADLVWIEYFDDAMECTGREGARVENVSAGGMRVAVRAAPAELERVIVSYPYRGFESCSIVRSRYRDSNGLERLCLEFADRSWRTGSNTAGAHAQKNVEQRRTRKILLADDDMAFRKILGNLLLKAGYDVVLAEDGEKALQQAKRESPDLVITDGLMPKLHGFQVCKAIKELSPPPKVILLTAVYTSPNYMWEAQAKFGADDIMTKPCQINDLLRTIEKHLSASVPAA